MDSIIARVRCFETLDEKVFVEGSSGQETTIKKLVDESLATLTGTVRSQLLDRMSIILQEHQKYHPEGAVQLGIDPDAKFLSLDVIHTPNHSPSEGRFMCQIGRADLSESRFPRITSDGRRSECTLSRLDPEERSQMKMNGCLARLGVAAKDIAETSKAIVNMLDAIGSRLPGSSAMFLVEVKNKDGHLDKVVFKPISASSHCNQGPTKTQIEQIKASGLGPFKDAVVEILSEGDGGLAEVVSFTIKTDKKKDQKEQKTEFPNKLNETWWNNRATFFSNREDRHTLCKYIVVVATWLFKRIICLTNEPCPTRTFVIAKREHFKARDTGKALDEKEVTALFAYLEKTSSHAWEKVKPQFLKGMYFDLWDGLAFTFEYNNEKSSLEVTNKEGKVIFFHSL